MHRGFFNRATLGSMLIGVALTLVFDKSAYTNVDSLDAGISAMKRGHYATALRAFRNLAKRGNAQAENNIGFLYERGLGVPQDYNLALIQF